MCRHLAYVGPPVSPAEMLIDPPHSLARQSWAPADMRGGGTVNVDGFGAGWYPGAGDPVRYRRAQPIWADEGFPALMRSVRVQAFVGAVRSATVGMPGAEGACAPFSHGKWLFSHNGRVAGWPDSVAGLAARLPTTRLLTLDAPTDSALLWALVLDRLQSGQDSAKAIAETVLEVEDAAPGSRLNLLLTDGETIIATSWTHALSVLDTGDAVVVASEPYDDDPRWQTVPDARLVRATPGSVEVHELRTGER